MREVCRDFDLRPGKSQQRTSAATPTPLTLVEPAAATPENGDRIAATAENPKAQQKPAAATPRRFSLLGLR